MTLITKTKAPIWRKLALLTTLFALAPAGAISLSLLDANEAMVEAVSREVRLTSTESVATAIDHTLEGAREDLSGVALALSDPSLASAQRIGLARTVVGASGAIDHAIIYDASGAWIDTIREEALEYEPSTGALSEAAREDAARAGASLSPPSGVRARLLVPMRASGRVTGFVASEVSLEETFTRVRQLAEERFGGSTSALVVTTSQGRVTAAADVEQVGQDVSDAALRARIEEVMAAPGVAISGDVDGEVPALVTLRPLEQTPWVVVASVPQREAYAPLVRMKQVVLGALTLAVLLSIALAIWFSRRLTRPIGALVSQCVALARRDFGARVEVDTGDELALLGETLNRAAQDLAESEAEIRRQERVRHDLGRYLPREVVERVMTPEGAAELEGHRAEVTVLFADVVSFTPMCEALSPEQTVAILNELFTIVTEIVFRHGGVVDKFIGDCVMAFWGAPGEQPDHALRALEAAEDILSWLDIGNATWRETFGVELELAVGVNTGEAIVGNVGSRDRVAYTVIGDAVNLAARLEAIARPNQILTTHETAIQAGEDFDIVHVGEKRLPGVEDPVALYEVRP